MKRSVGRSVNVVLAITVLAVTISCSVAPSPLVWSFRTERPWLLAGDSHAYTPAVDGESAFFCGGYFLDDDDAIHAISLQDGSLQWTHPVGTCESAPFLTEEAVGVDDRKR